MPDVNTDAVRPPYLRAVESRRPYGTHRFDVFSLKAQRRLTLFGVAALRQWLRLEASPAVKQLCERPVLLPERKKPVDFWSTGTERSVFTVLCSETTAIAAGEGEMPYPAFEEWARSVGCEVELVSPSELAGGPVWYANWTDLLQHLARYQSSVTDRLEAQVMGVIVDASPISLVLEAIADVDRAVVRAAVFSLIHKGMATLRAAENVRLCDASEVAMA